MSIYRLFIIFSTADYSFGLLILISLVRKTRNSLKIWLIAAAYELSSSLDTWVFETIIWSNQSCGSVNRLATPLRSSMFYSAACLYLRRPFFLTGLRVARARQSFFMICLFSWLMLRFLQFPICSIVHTVMST